MQVKAETEGEQKINNSYQGLYKQMVEAMRGFGVEAVSGSSGRRSGCCSGCLQQAQQRAPASSLPRTGHAAAPPPPPQHHAATPPAAQVATVGELFDPNVHEAIMREPSEEVPDGSVLMEFRKGFRLGDRLLRPAMVKVSFSESTPAVAPAEEAVREEEPALSE